MLQHRYTFACLAACFLISPIASAAEKTVTAEVEAVDADKKTITIDDQTLDVTRKTKIVINGKQATLADIEAGQKVKVKFDDELEVALSITLSDAEAPAGDTLVSLKGTWVAVAEESGGKRMKKEDLKKAKKTLEITGDKFILSWSGKTMTGKLEHVADESPNAIDLSGKLPSGSAAVLRGIYELKNEQLRICYRIYVVNGEEVTRPTEFETEENEKERNAVCVTYERKK